MDFSWNDIYQDFLNCKEKKCSEREFQNNIYSVFRYYLRWQNCVVAEESIPIGAANTIRPDFVLYKDNLPQVVIESKEPNHIQTERNKEQLFSYMRQKKVDFGLYIGEMIQLYYDVPTDVEMPLLIFTLDYRMDSRYGSSFVNFFNFIDFDRNQLVDFCSNRIQEIQKERQIELDTQQLLSDDGVKLCETLLKSHFASKGYSEADVEILMNDIEIVLRRKSQTVQTPLSVGVVSSTPVVSRYEYKPSKKRQMYSVNGKGAYCKNRSALELVRSYLRDHPSSYHTIVSVFNGHVPNYVSSKEEVEYKEGESYDRSKTKRWHKDSPLVSSDGVTFYVTTQVGDNCPTDFKDIVSLSEDLGYKIELLS
ncbi:MAG: type I restriction enzyme HsdR N-terminal domain-containing protein [Bacteroidaceae bacterium]|nr:type I restriction enzyme HsdR N-terminal domain-containing protein [Bacteroidaceae bacterium]